MGNLVSSKSFLSCNCEDAQKNAVAKDAHKHDDENSVNREFDMQNQPHVTMAAGCNLEEIFDDNPVPEEDFYMADLQTKDASIDSASPNNSQRSTESTHHVQLQLQNDSSSVTQDCYIHNWIDSFNAGTSESSVNHSTGFNQGEAHMIAESPSPTIVAPTNLLNEVYEELHLQDHEQSISTNHSSHVRFNPETQVQTFDKKDPAVVVSTSQYSRYVEKLNHFQSPSRRQSPRRKSVQRPSQQRKSPPKKSPRKSPRKPVKRLNAKSKK